MNRKRKSKTKTPENIYWEWEKNDDFFITTIELTYEHQEKQHKYKEHTTTPKKNK